MVARRVRAALAAMAAVLVIAGCGPDEPAGSASQKNAPAGSAAPTQNGFASRNNLESDPVVQFNQRAGNLSPPRAKPGELLVKFKASTSKMRIAAALPRASVASMRPFALVPGLHHVKLAPGVALESALAQYRARSDVEYAEPNYIVRTSALPNDPRFSEQWGLNNTGQTGGVADADIDAPAAWDLVQGSNDVVVAVIDSGVDYTHPDLAANIFHNVSDCNNNGIDDDGNGYIDDCNGIDTLNNDSDPMDDNGHGTHVAGIIGAVGNNGVGISGVAWNVRILPCKFIGPDGSGSIADAIACLDYVASFAARGVKVVATNNSWGGGLFSQALSQAVAAQRQQGILFVAAAGNDGADHDAYQEYPCSYDSPNILCVSATTEFDILPVFSDFGRHTVHIGAPGFDILSTLPGNTYGKETGTSMAAPHVTGVAALLKAQDPTRDWRAIRNLILTGGKLRTAMTNTISGREVSAYGSLTCSNSPLMTRLQPVSNDVPMRALGSPLLLSMLNINCASPNGALTVTVSNGTNVTLHDDGLNGDVAANDGIYSALWTPPAAGAYTLTFPNGDVVTTLTDAQLEPGFPVQTLSLASSYQGGPVIHTLVGNIDADPDLEILRSGLAVGPLYAWKHDGTPAAGWPRTIFQSTGTYLDISGVAYPVLGHFTSSTDHLDVFANYTGLIKAAYDGAGNTLPGWPLSTYSEVPGAAADIDGDGLDNIIVENNDDVSKDFIEIHRPDGTQLPGWPITLPPLPAASKTRTPALADLFGDGEIEIISTDLDRVYAYHRDGSVVSGFPVDLSATSVRSYPVVGDVDGDGAPEIVVVSQVQDPTHAAFIVILSNTGAIKRTIVTPFQVVRDVAPALADLTGDGIPEIVLDSHAVGDGGLGVWRGDGTTLPGWPILINNWSGNTAPVVGDIDGDGFPDVVITTQVPGQSQGDVRAYDRAGVALAGFPKMLNLGSGAVPAIADLNLDGRNKLIVSGSYWPGYPGYYETLWEFDLGGPAAHGPVEWGQFMNDAKHSGFYKTGKNLAGFAFLAAQVRGNGTITSAPAGISCGTDCIERYAKGTSVTLTATGSNFGSWRGACAGQGNPCTVSIQDYTTVVAQFGNFTLSVTPSGDGAGTVTSTPGGISCPGTCSASYNSGNVVTLTATPQASAYFSGWSGACTGTATTCSVTMDTAKSVTANFSAKPVLQVSTIGTGSGAVTSSPAGINCGSVCSKAYDVGTSVTLTAAPAPGSRFDGWLGGTTCSGTTPTCTVIMGGQQPVQAIFTAQIVRALTVTKTGAGTGSVISQQPGINCGADCSETYLQDTQAVLTATPDTGSTFVGWTGACNSNMLTCSVFVDAPKAVTANFAQSPPHFTLNVNLSGTGSGNVVSLPAGINCGADCSEDYQLNVVVTLTAAANADSVFNGWSGACSGTATTCTVLINGAKTVGAIFSQLPSLPLTVTRSGSGGGTVASLPTGISCGGNCSANYLLGAVVTLTATANPDSVFTGWSGACSGTSATCSITMATGESVTSNFVLKPVLSVSLSGAGSGTVTSDSAGILCGTACSATYSPSSLVTLTAAASQGSAFDGWSGACSGQSTSCSITMDASKSVVAAFRTVAVANNPPSSGGGGGGGGGGRIDWLVLAPLATALLIRQRRSMRQALFGLPRQA